MMLSEGEEYPEPTVAGIVTYGDSLVLLTQSQKWHDKFALPGGHMRKGESIFESLQREMKEETNLDIVSGDLLYIEELKYPEEFYDSGRHFIVFVFRCRPKSYNQVRLNDEAYRYQWLPLADISKFPLTEWSKKAIGKLNDQAIAHFGPG
jgi:nucleoside triphosphatase